MKFNWGTGIVVTMIMFISFIMYMVVSMMLTHTDVVEKDYYAQQIGYQETKEAKENGLKLAGEMSFFQSKEYFQVKFPDSVNMKTMTKGGVHFYRPENASLDRKFEIIGVGNVLKIPMNQLKEGHYQVKIRWENNGKEYYFEESITLR